MSTEVRITDPKTGGQKGQKDERFDLMPWDALEEVARVYGFGAKKYAPDNWLKGYSWRLSFGALVRHVAKAMIGEDCDAETGCLHLACAAWHCLTLITFLKRGLGTDDRAKVTLRIDVPTPSPTGNISEATKAISNWFGARNVPPPLPTRRNVVPDVWRGEEG